MKDRLSSFGERMQQYGDAIRNGDVETISDMLTEQQLGDHSASVQNDDDQSKHDEQQLQRAGDNSTPVMTATPGHQEQVPESTSEVSETTSSRSTLGISDTDPREGCPWKCVDDAPHCLCMKKHTRQQLQDVIAEKLVRQETVQTNPRLPQEALVDRSQHCAECERMSQVLWDIAHMNRKPRPDGTYNYSREALIDMARAAINDCKGFTA